MAGWAKRGPTGIIGTNRADGCETAQSIIECWPELLKHAPGGGSLSGLLALRATVPLSHADWQKLDGQEKANGLPFGKPREKLLSMQAAREALQVTDAYV